MDKNYKPGDIVDIPEEYHNVLMDSMLKIESYQNALKKFFVNLFTEKRKFWDLILKIFPNIELNTCVYDKKNNKIIITENKNDELTNFDMIKMFESYISYIQERKKCKK
jgi:hypothetical protein